jgi:hypothetical protein
MNTPAALTWGESQINKERDLTYRHVSGASEQVDASADSLLMQRLGVTYTCI